jgi:hypothetical protein
MARVDLTLADEVKRYASLHRQPISVVIRDALTLLMEEYPWAGDRSDPHPLAVHELLSDRYESPLDMLLLTVGHIFYFRGAWGMLGLAHPTATPSPTR